MKKYITLSLLAAVLVVAPAPPAAAHDGEDHSAPGRAGRSSQVQAQAQQSRQDVRQRVEEIRQDVEQRRTEIKQMVCQRRQAALQRAIPRLGIQATTLKTVIDTLYTRVQSFYDSGQLTVENYAALQTAVDDAGAQAAVSVAAVEEFEFELDCNNPNVAEQLDGFRQAVQAARSDLKEYRAALAELISAMRAAAAVEQNPETEPVDSDSAEHDEATNTPGGNQQ